MRGVFILVLIAGPFAAPFAFAIDPPPQALKLIEDFKAKEKAAKTRLEAEIAALRAQAKKETEESKKLLVAELDKVRIALEKEEKHNEARAVAARIRSLTNPPANAAPAPANMTAYAGNPANLEKSFLFRLTARLEGGTVWGVGPYTSDSDLARAAVHAGVAAPGESAIIKVTLVSTAGTDFASNTQNGITTSPYASWPTGYRLERATSEEAEGVIEAEDPAALDGESDASDAAPPPTSPRSGKLEILGPRSGPAPAPK